MKSHFPKSCLRILPLGLLVALGQPVPGRAVTFTAVQTGPDTWVYNMTFAPWDNYSVFPYETTATNVTTITFSGLTGVTAAFGPTSADFGDTFLNNLNLNWTAQVLNGGTTVVWSHVGPGTGNWSTEKHVNGFSILAPGVTNGLIAYSTSGMHQDYSQGGLNVDVFGTIAGPAAIPEPSTWALLTIGVGAMVGTVWRRRRR